MMLKEGLFNRVPDGFLSWSGAIHAIGKRKYGAKWSADDNQDTLSEHDGEYRRRYWNAGLSLARDVCAKDFMRAGGESIDYTAALLMASRALRAQTSEADIDRIIGPDEVVRLHARIDEELQRDFPSRNAAAKRYKSARDWLYAKVVSGEIPVFVGIGSLPPSAKVRPEYFLSEHGIASIPHGSAGVPGEYVEGQNCSDINGPLLIDQRGLERALSNRATEMPKSNEDSHKHRGGVKVGPYADHLKRMLAVWKESGHPNYELPTKTLANRIRKTWSVKERKCKLPVDSTLRGRIDIIRTELDGASS